MTGGQAASSSIFTLSSWSILREDDLKAPYSTPKLPWPGETGRVLLKYVLAGSDMPDKLVMREEITSGDAGVKGRRVPSSPVRTSSRRDLRPEECGYCDDGCDCDGWRGGIGAAE